MIYQERYSAVSVVRYFIDDIIITLMVERQPGLVQDTSNLGENQKKIPMVVTI